MASIRSELEQRLFVEGADDGAFPPRPRRIVADCRKALGDNDIICMDNGIYKIWFSRHYRAFDISTFLIDNTLATMGAGLPSALGAKMVAPDRRVLAVTGDGGFMMNSQELETAVRLKLPVVTLVLNDNGFGFIKWKQQSLGLPDFALDLGNPDFVRYAESYGAKGYRVEATDQLSHLLEKAFRQEVPTLIECPIDYSENAEVWNKELEEIISPLD
jgi:acetolactate synthase-1/2/3 large subunit